MKLTSEWENGAEVLLVTPGHLLWSLDDGGWEEAGHLVFGEKIAALHGSVALTTAAEYPSTSTVYNLEVANWHTYFVGRVGIWAHNTCFPNARRLQEIFKTTKEGWHRTVKRAIVKRTENFGRKIGAKNPDIGIGESGNIVLKNPKTGKTIATDVPYQEFVQ